MKNRISSKKFSERINGDSVYLRPVSLKDARTIQKWHNDPELMLLARIGEEKTTLKQEKEDIKNAINSSNQVYNMIVKRVNKVPIGFIRFHYIDKISGNIWLRMLMGEKKTRGKGYAREALWYFLEWVFNKLNIHRVTLEVYSTNKRAIKFYEKIGFQREGVLREALLIDGIRYDIFSYGLLKKEFKYIK